MFIKAFIFVLSATTPPKMPDKGIVFAYIAFIFPSQSVVYPFDK